MDYNNNILAEAQYKDLIDSVKACVVVRNGNAPTGTNGVAFCFPARMISSYSPTYEQLDAMGLENEKAVCNDYFSIMASQQTKALSNDSFLKEFAHTDTYGKKVRVLRDGALSVKDEPFGECDLQFGGMLTDIYQRTFLTETLETHVEK